MGYNSFLTFTPQKPTDVCNTSVGFCFPLSNTREVARKQRNRVKFFYYVSYSFASEVAACIRGTRVSEDWWQKDHLHRHPCTNSHASEFSGYRQKERLLLFSLTSTIQIQLACLLNFATDGECACDGKEVSAFFDSVVVIAETEVEVCCDMGADFVANAQRRLVTFRAFLAV